MSRLTEKNTDSLEYRADMSDMYGTKGITLYEKLGKLEDIEEEYGIEITTLSKLLKQGFVYIRDGASIEKNQGFIIDSTGLWSQVRLDPKKYGKKEPGGWALTKEELQ